MEYTFSFNTAQGIFALPCSAVDLYINEASAEDMKVLLFVFRHSGEALNEDRICHALALGAGQVGRSLAFWSGKKLISFAEAPEKSAETPAAEAAKPPKRVVEQRAQYTSDEIACKLESDGGLRFLLETASRLLGKLLSQADCSTLIYLHDGAGLPADVILMLIEYCAASGHANMRYIEKMALTWAEDGICTHENAENRIRELEARRSFEGQVRSIMGIAGRTLTSAERQHLARWAQWGMPPELVKFAYEICVNRTGKLAFSYINSILAAWHEKGYTTVEQAKNEKAKQGGKKPSYDIDEYVDLSIKRILNE